MEDSQKERSVFEPPSVSLPKGGGAIRGIGEKFSVNPATGTGSLSVPLPLSEGRNSFTPKLSLSYDSGSGNGPFGLGWSLSLPSITRKTEKGLPLYRDGEESDVFILLGAEDLVPVLNPDGSRFEERRRVNGEEYLIHRYRPRTEGLFAHIERWTRLRDGDVHWRSISRDNVLTIYGRDGNSRIADPADPRRIFRWLISESRDDRGNAILYLYRAEDSEGVGDHLHERNRTPEGRSSNRYIKRILYCNRKPLLDEEGRRPHFVPEEEWERAGWIFEVVFDYDEGHYSEFSEGGHTYAHASPTASKPWSVRPDPFSTYRAGFEIRTYRRCRRILIFHHIPGEYEGLVRSLELDYRDMEYREELSPEEEILHQGSTRLASFLCGITQSGYVRRQNGYLKRSLPPLEFEYSKPSGLGGEVRELPAESLENLPSGLDERLYRWVDLDGEGVSGVLIGGEGAWYYKPNLGGGEFGPLRRVLRKPSTGGGRFMDLAGDGRLDFVRLEGQGAGFYERDDGEGWESFRPFTSVPNVLWGDPNLRLVDLTGDGRADVLITEEEVFVWYPSLGEKGFGEGKRVLKALNEERGPRVIFSDGTQTIFLADMSGDGLPDIVRIRNREVCYWPNLGYGRFGAKVSMDNAPLFDTPDQFDPRRIRLADVDGSGTTDIIYLRGDGVFIYFNQSGNRLSAPYRLGDLPPVNDLSSVNVVDLLGTGTACLVWSSPLPSASGSPLRYVDLMGGRKPHLLVRIANNLGAETRLTYAPSTKFYLEDKRRGRVWITRLPFPVYVVERVETYDHVSRNRFVSRYAYHHGYFDGEEREFRGFGMVERWDTEEYSALTEGGGLPRGDNWEEYSHVPPVYTKSWFHTGAYLGRERISKGYEEEYYREPGLTPEAVRELLLPDTVLPGDLTPEEEREACRALRGRMLRQEVYALDGTDREPHPYTVVEQNFTVRLIQRRGRNRHAVFFVHPRETLTYHYERSPEDPRIQHTLTLEVDDYGNVLKEVAIGYSRRETSSALMELEERDRRKQTTTLVTCTENTYTGAVNEETAYRTPLIAETRTYELTGYTPTGPAGRFQPSDFVQPDPEDPSRFIFISDRDIPYEASPTGGRERRLLECVRTRYRPDDLGRSAGDPEALLPLGVLESKALPGESYRLAFTEGLLRDVFRRNGEDLIPDPEGVLADLCGYVKMDGGWWVPSGRIFYSPEEMSAEEEFGYAREHFFLSLRFRDPFGQTTRVLYDPYDLLVIETEDPLGNTTRAVNDYRVLQPRLITDPNRNRSEVAFDALGLVVGTAVMGKEGEGLGDNLADFRTDLTEEEIRNHIADPLRDPHTLLGRATSRLVYDLFAYMRTREDPQPQPAVVWIMHRETHESDLGEGERTRILHTFSYSDGFGREIQKKTLAEPGPVPARDGEGRIILGSDGLPVMRDHGGPRWVGSGWTVFNNKGKPVRQYEPFFTDTHRFEFDVRIGVSPIILYDPVGRVVATLHPNHTYEKVVFDPWRQESWDVNDTVLLNPAEDPDVGALFRRLPEESYQPTWYTLRTGTEHPERETALKTALHAGTPTVSHLDTLGRVFLTVTHNRYETEGGVREEYHRTRVELDVQGNTLSVTDAADRIVMRYAYSMVGPTEDEEGNRQDTHRIHQASMEAGERWILRDVENNPVLSWDSRGHRVRTEYDELRRPLHVYVRGADPDEPEREVLTERIVYGEAHPRAEERNLRTRIYLHLDQSGLLVNERFDFKGNLLHSRRRLAREYRKVVDWSADTVSVPGDLESALSHLLEEESFTSRTLYDALNRPVQIAVPHRSAERISVLRYLYNEANLLEQVHAWLSLSSLPAEPLDPETADLHLVTDIDYNARGQRERIAYGNGAVTTYEYDRQTFRLVRLRTVREAPENEPPLPIFKDSGLVQDLLYTYDPAGNITRIEDASMRTLFHSGQRVDAVSRYTYDALYRLVEATGREHIGQTELLPRPPDGNYRDYPLVGFRATDPNALRPYTERYEYDPVGNILKVIHRTGSGGWIREYFYEEQSLLEPGKFSNRLSRTRIGDTVEHYTHDEHGNMVSMSHLRLMLWDYRDQLRAISRQLRTDGNVPETTYYTYSAEGQRIRRVTEAQHPAGGTPPRKKERIYLGGIEIYREYDSDGNVTLERETLHIMDDEQRIALIETRTAGSDPAPRQLVRYQIGNHLGSVSLELDQNARIISYEEYYPYGATSYQLLRTETPKRYRYTGMERDEESGLSYHTARYYAPWLGRWVSCDPMGYLGAFHLYAYAKNNPIRFHDKNGGFDIDQVLTFSLREFINEDTSYFEGVLYGLGEGVLGALQMGFEGMMRANPFFGWHFLQRDFELVQAIYELVSDERKRRLLIRSLKDAIGDWWQELTFEGTSGEAGYQHGKLLFDVILTILGIGAIKHFLKTGRFTSAALRRLRRFRFREYLRARRVAKVAWEVFRRRNYLQKMAEAYSKRDWNEFKEALEAFKGETNIKIEWIDPTGDNNLATLRLENNQWVLRIQRHQDKIRLMKEVIHDVSHAENLIYQSQQGRPEVVDLFFKRSAGSPVNSSVFGNLQSENRLFENLPQVIEYIVIEGGKKLTPKISDFF